MARSSALMLVAVSIGWLSLAVGQNEGPGPQKNNVVVRVHTNHQPAQMSGGLVSRLFLYSPNEALNLK